MRIIISFLLFTFSVQLVSAQGRKSHFQTFRAKLFRKDGNIIPFRFQLDKRTTNPVIYVMNAGERLRVDSVRFFNS